MNQLVKVLAFTLGLFAFTSGAQANKIIQATLYCNDYATIASLAEAGGRMPAQKIGALILSYAVQGDCGITVSEEPFYVEPTDYKGPVQNKLARVHIWEGWLYEKREKSGQYVIQKIEKVFVIVDLQAHNIIQNDLTSY